MQCLGGCCCQPSFSALCAWHTQRVALTKVVKRHYSTTRSNSFIFPFLQMALAKWSTPLAMFTMGSGTWVICMARLLLNLFSSQTDALVFRVIGIWILYPLELDSQVSVFVNVQNVKHLKFKVMGNAALNCFSSLVRVRNHIIKKAM